MYHKLCSWDYNCLGGSLAQLNSNRDPFFVSGNALKLWVENTDISGLKQYVLLLDDLNVSV